MSIIDKMLYNPISINGENIDSRYFKDNGDGTYTATPLFVYNVARDATKFFKDRIFELDVDHLYSSSSVREVKDTWAEKMHNRDWKDKYGDLIEEANKEWYKYREEHPDEFEPKGKRIAIGNEDDARFFSAYSPDAKCSLTTAVQQYNAARELAAKFSKPDKDGNEGSEYKSLPFTEPLYSKEEFADQHKAFRKSVSDRLGIPDDEFIAGKVEKVVHRINNRRCDKAGSNDTVFEPYIEGLIKHITSSTAIEFKNKLANLKQDITENFIYTINDNSRSLKAIEDKSNTYSIYTIPTEDTDAIKIITLVAEDNVDDGYKYIFKASSGDEDLKYSKSIMIKADLIKAINNTIAMIEDVKTFSSYAEDLKNVLETL